MVSDSDPGDASVDYEQALAQASALVLAHLRASPADLHLSRERHDEASTLYAAVTATFPELEGMRLTSLMWDHVVGQAVAAYLAEGDEFASGE